MDHMSQDHVEAVKIAASRIFEWLSRLIQALLLAGILWFGPQFVEFKTQLAVIFERMERNTELYGSNLLALSRRVDENDRRDDRQQSHIEAVDARVRDLELRSRLP